MGRASAGDARARSQRSTGGSIDDGNRRRSKAGPSGTEHTRGVYNFSAGPAVLPEAVLRRDPDRDVWDIDGTGIGILEHSHRGPVVDAIWQRTEAACRKLAGIPDDYAVLYLQGGASTQFSMVPANFLPEGATADYINTGAWVQEGHQGGQALRQRARCGQQRGEQLRPHPRSGPVLEQPGVPALYQQQHDLRHRVCHRAELPGRIVPGVRCLQ
ncbi:MAG: hypothetical protein KatS3mg103_0019 [Phycisphaerales bacterium]|nr:MAG: hypothetical protein KatS3mg103_0019 [Phycisphaerales bacterium]